MQNILNQIECFDIAISDMYVYIMNDIKIVFVLICC